MEENTVPPQQPQAPHVPPAAPAPGPGSQQHEAPKPPKDPVPPVTGPAAPVEKFFYDYFYYHAPFHLPKGLKDFLVKIFPYLAALGVIFSIRQLLYALGIMQQPAVDEAVQRFYGLSFGLSPLERVQTIGSFILNAVALPGLFKMQRMGWVYVFYSFLFSLIMALLMVNIVAFIVGGVVGGYLVMQFREYYK